MVLWYMCACKFIYTQKESAAFPVPFVVKLKNAQGHCVDFLYQMSTKSG
jgi:hypothetical protein